MPKYVYGCDHKEHPRIEVEHRIEESYSARCEVCGSYLHKIPQPFRFYGSPLYLLRDWSEDNWSRKLRGEPRDYYNVSSKVGIPQKDFEARK